MMASNDSDLVLNRGTFRSNKGETNFEQKHCKQPCIAWATVKDLTGDIFKRQINLPNEVVTKKSFSDTQQDHKMQTDDNSYSLEGHDDFDQVVNECFSDLDDNGHDNTTQDEKNEHYQKFLFSPTPFRSDQHQNSHNIVMAIDSQSEQSVKSCERPQSKSLLPSSISILQLDNDADMKPHGTFQVQPRRHSIPLTPSFGKQENEDLKVFQGDSYMVDLTKNNIHVDEDITWSEPHDHEPLNRDKSDTSMNGNISSECSHTSNCTADSQFHGYYPSTKFSAESPCNKQHSANSSESIRPTVDRDSFMHNSDHHRRTPDEGMDQKYHRTFTSYRKAERRGSLPSSFVYIDHQNPNDISTNNACPSTFHDSKAGARPLSQGPKLATFSEEQQAHHYQQQEQHSFVRQDHEQQYHQTFVHHNHEQQYHQANQDKRMKMDLDEDGLTTKYRVLMRKSSMSQRALQAWDTSMGLPKNHSPSMVNSSKSRQQLQDGVILTTYRGKPLAESIASKKMKRRLTSPY